MRVLIVEDEDSLRETLAGNLELENFDVDEATNGNEALRRLESSDYDVVISDIRMPGMTGVELVEEMRRRKYTTPVVLMTAFTAEDRLHRAVESGVFTVLPKPFDVDHAIRVLSRASARPRVLVVDDVEEEAMAMVDALRSSHVAAEHATSIADAIARVESSCVDVCLTDLVMPQGDGVELARRLRSEHGVAVIVFSGRDVPEMMRQAASLGAHACLRKPVSPTTVVRSVAHARAEQVKS